MNEKKNYSTKNIYMKNLIGLWVNLARAYEIALLGDFSVQVVCQLDYKQGLEDFEEIKKFYDKIKFSTKGDMVVEIYEPDYHQNVNYEKLVDIHDRVSKAKENSRPTKFKNKSCDSLLKTATEKLSLSSQKIDKTVEVAKTIAQLDNSNTICPEHIAEAIQYNCYHESCRNLADGSVEFGGIKINTIGLDLEDIDNAINYLNNLKTDNG